MLVSKQFNQIAQRKPWRKQFNSLIKEYGKPLGGAHTIPDEIWNTFLVDIGQRKSRGLGDTIAKITKALGVKKPCGGCKKRRRLANKVLPYKK
jgi:hypothetical protein